MQALPNAPQHVLSGYEGIVEGSSISRSPSATHGGRRQDDRTATIEDRDGDPGQHLAPRLSETPPPYREALARNGSCEDHSQTPRTAPGLIPKISELTKSMPSSQQTSMPMLVSPEGSECFESVRDDDTLSQRPNWINQPYSEHKPSVLDAEKAKVDAFHRSEQAGWDDDRSARRRWMDAPMPMDAQQSARSSWTNETDSVAAQSAQLGWMETRSVDAPSTRPGWINEEGSVGAPSTRLGWNDDTGSINAQSEQPGWSNDMASVTDDPGFRRLGLVHDTASVGAQSVRPGWINETSSRMDDTESVGFHARQSSWLAKPDSVVHESELARPDRIQGEARSQSPGWVNGKKAFPTSGGRLSGWDSPKNTQEDRVDGHEMTMGGQSSSEGAARPQSELAESPPTIAKRVTGGAARDMSGKAHHGDGGSDMSDEGGLLGLIMETNREEAIRRRTARLRSTERARRVFSSSPPERTSKEMGDSPRQQAPRQPTAEVPAAKITILRSNTSPPSESVSTPTQRAVRAKRSLTPTARSNFGEGVATSSPPARRDMPSLNGNDRAREYGGRGRRDGTNKISSIRRNASSDRADAIEVGAKEARRFSSGVSRVSFEGLPHSDSPRKIGKKASSPARDPTTRPPIPAPVVQRGSGVAVLPRTDGGVSSEREMISGSTPRGKPPLPSETPDSAGSENSALGGKPVDPEFRGSKGPQSSPRKKPPTMPERTLNMPPLQVVISVSSPAHKPRDTRKRGGSKSRKPKESADGSSRKSNNDEARPRRSSETSSTSSSDSANHGNGNTRRRDRLRSSEVAAEAVDLVRGRTSLDQPPAQPTPGRRASSTSAPSAPKREIKMWNSKDPAGAAAAASSASAAADADGAAEPEALAPALQLAVGHAQGVVLPLSKQILPTGRRVRGQQPFKLGTPRERKTTRNPSRTRMRIRSDLPPLEEEVGIPTSPVATSINVRWPGDFSGSAHADKNHTAMGSDKDLADRLLAEKLGKALHHGAPITSPGTLPNSTANSLPLEVAAASATKTQRDAEHRKPSARAPDKDEAAKSWLNRRAQRHSGNLSRDDSFRRRGSQRLSRSSSWDDLSCSSFGQRAMFSPGRFNPTAGALSWVGSVDDSWCDSSVRSAMTAGTRNSSTTSLSARGLSDRKLVTPQLSKGEKQTVERLKIKRSDVHFGYRPLEGSDRVYKIELNGEMRAAKVFDTLGMSKEEMTEVLDTFDAELLALSRLSTPHIVQAYGASVSPAEIIMVSEFVEGGVLRRLLHNPLKLKDLTQRVRLGIAKDIALGMRSLYAHGMQHRHLSSDSILLTSDYRAKILGVGLTMTTELIDFFTGDKRAEEQAEKELPWASREVLAGAGFSEKSDVYSFGIVFWEIMQKDPSLPYANLLPSQVVGAKYNGEGPSIPEDCPVAISRLMKSCWSNLPADRPSFDKVVDALEALCL
ncbi:Zn binding domain-containing protein [Ectocarpus siliculosus]|uniref:Zn binding domain-containing protein n=1 Tax=Ectocarpus siliculosus TaxID=2880 RepID=D7FPQ4_ECTSI|nr:Zn binding domain-containing protein [Ectocarpus siliculosus]|eukprot:CBJ30511.1 Zn binding domain-containing protein [Ectocarpus siliculosus]